MNMMTTQEVADFLKIGYNQSLHFIKYSGVRHTRIGNQYRVRDEDLIRHLFPSEETPSLSHPRRPLRNTMKK